MQDPATEIKVVDFKVYTEAEPYLNKLQALGDKRKDEARNNRDLRRLNFDVIRERSLGKIAADELLIPQHVIDTNIRREQSRYVAYVTSSRRAVVAINVADTAAPTEVFEKDFTNRVRYTGWQTPMFKVIDGMQLHKAASFEIVLDETKPGHVDFVYVAYEDLVFYEDTMDIQACEVVGRRLNYTKTQLLALRKFPDINKVQLASLLNSASTRPENDNSLISLYKIFFRDETGTVFWALWSKSEASSTYLVPPRPLHLGRWKQVLVPQPPLMVPHPMMPELAVPQPQPPKPELKEVYETEYPVVYFPYLINEDEVCADAQGRADLDKYTQDAVTSLISSYVTGNRRAANFYFKEAGQAAMSSTVQQTNQQFVPNQLIKGNIEQFQLSPPAASVIGTAQALLSLNQQETSQINFAALNRKDSEKTATEIDAAQNESSMLSASQLALFSNSIRELYDKALKIISNRVVMGLLEVTPNLQEAYAQTYVIRPSGDVDVVERQEKLRLMMEAWPVVGKTGAANVFLIDLMTAMFPDRAEVYAKAIQDADMTKQLLQQCATVIKELVTDDSGQVEPQFQQFMPQLEQLAMQIQQVLAPSPESGQQPAQ